MALVLSVVDPVVVWKVEEPLVTVETRADVLIAEAEGKEVAPATPLRPESVADPVLVMVEDSPEKTLVNALVVTADDEPPKMVDDPTIVVMVESPLVKVEKRTVVVTAEDATDAEGPEADAPPPAPAPPPVPLVAVVVTMTEAEV